MIFGLTVALSALVAWSLVNPMDIIIVRASALGTKAAAAGGEAAPWVLVGGSNGDAKSVNKEKIPSLKTLCVIWLKYELK